MARKKSGLITCLLAGFVLVALATPALAVDKCRGQNETSNVGTPGNDVIVGTAATETINGLGGEDLICGEGGNDILSGGEGNDRIWAHNPPKGSASDQTTINGEAGDDFLVGGKGTDTINGGDGNDTVDDLGNSNDTINGGAGDDHLNGDNGNDTIHGEDGNDRINGGTGNDTIKGGEGDDLMECDHPSRGPDGTADSGFGGPGDDDPPAATPDPAGFSAPDNDCEIVFDPGEIMES